MKRTKLWGWVAVGLSFVLLGGTSALGQDSIRIGTLYPFTGPLAMLGTEEWRGAETARVVQNEKGGVLGKKIEFVKADAPDAKAATSEAERLITVEKVKIITGSYSSSIAYASTPVAEKYQVIYFEQGGIADNITQRGFKYLFRNNPLASDFGIRAIDLSEQTVCPKIGLKPANTKIAVIYEDSLYGTTVGTSAVKYGKERGFRIVADEPYSAKAVDLSSLIMKLKSAQPDILIATSYVNDAILISRQSKELKFNVKEFIGCGGGHGTKDTADALGDDINYIFNVDITQPRNTSEKFCPGIAEYSSRYQKIFGHPPRSGHSLRAYNGLLIAFDIIKKAGSLDAEALRQAALSIDIPEGKTPTGWGVKFAPPGHPSMGTNLRAKPIVMQWFEQEQYAVWPALAAVKDMVIPLPSWEERAKGKK
jgi:branched-chain amino acid transport system substrate-binding protein